MTIPAIELASGDELPVVGLGLWNYPVIAFLLELGLLVGGMILYIRKTQAASRRNLYGMIAFGGLMVGIQLMVFFGAPPKTDTEVAISALVAYFLFAAIIWRLERGRKVIPSPARGE